jgi:23S rRNA (cytosine1962-C5)-methyltransferase
MLKPRCGKRAKNGHPWIFSNEINHPQTLPEAGRIAAVRDDGGNFVGYATYNPHCLIALRILSRVADEFPGSPSWFEQKIRQALQLRQRLYPHRKSLRVIYAESDGLPGIIVDRYEDTLVVQIQTAGMERMTEPIKESLIAVFSPKSIILRNTGEKRKLEALPLNTKVIYGEEPGMIEIDDNGARLLVDVKAGQKTGHFFDQADNRQALIPFARDAEALDLFCHTGAWSIQLILAGAKSSVAIDASKAAINLARRNAERNGIDKQIECIESDAFEWLANARKQKKRYDVVVVDPPAFAKTAKQVKKALRGYEDINRQAIHLVRSGGILCTCSCSYFIDEEQFHSVLHNAAAREHRTLKLLQIRGQAADHPILLAMPESRYLKCVIALVENG